MRTVPRDHQGRIQFYINHLQPWSEHAQQLGFSAEQITDLAQAITAAQQAFAAAQAARNAARTATEAMHNAIKTLHDSPGLGSDMIDAIRNRASSTDNQSLFTLAEIPAPRSDTAPPPPSTPTDIRTSLRQTGEVELRWKSSAPRDTQGTVYQIERAADGNASDGPFEFVGIAGERKFIDATLPAGPELVTYRITAIRGRSRSQTGTHTMHFGVVRPDSFSLTAPPLAA